MSILTGQRFKISTNFTKPILKWAGGKGQLLHEIKTRSPRYFEKYIEPFFGGGALFFDLKPQKSVIADSNPELINLYRAISRDVDGVIKKLSKYENNKKSFYVAREKNGRS